MQKVAPSSRTLEFAPACKQLSLILLVLYPLSFCLTWYRVWWDSMIGLAVAAFGYYTLKDTNAQQLNLSHINYFYSGTILSMVSHVIAVAVVLYHMIQGHLFNNVLGLDAAHVEVPGWVFFGFLLVLLGIEITLTAFTIWRSNSLLAEIARNSVLTDLTRGSAHV